MADDLSPSHPSSTLPSPSAAPNRRPATPGTVREPGAGLALTQSRARRRRRPAIVSSSLRSALRRPPLLAFAFTLPSTTLERSPSLSPTRSSSPLDCFVPPTSSPRPGRRGRNSFARSMRASLRLAQLKSDGSSTGELQLRLELLRRLCVPLSPAEQERTFRADAPRTADVREPCASSVVERRRRPSQAQAQLDEQGARRRSQLSLHGARSNDLRV